MDSDMLKLYDLVVSVSNTELRTRILFQLDRIMEKLEAAGVLAQ